jgi:uncharacterized RDD family membrane protein YckC
MSTELNNQYAPPKSAVADVRVAGDNSNKAGRGARLGAVMLDGLIGSIGLMPAYFAFFKNMAVMGRAGNAFSVWAGLVQTGAWFFVGVVWVLTVLSINIYLMRKNGQTIGKKIVGIKVVRTDGSPVSLYRIFFLRYAVNTFFTLIPAVGPLYSLVDSLMIFGDARRCVHDHLADTIVIDA